MNLPENLLTGKTNLNPVKGVIKLIDFGIANNISNDVTR